MDRLRKLKTARLQQLLRDKGLSQSYRVKEDLVQRLATALQVHSRRKFGEGRQGAEEEEVEGEAEREAEDREAPAEEVEGPEAEQEVSSEAGNRKDDRESEEQAANFEDEEEAESKMPAGDEVKMTTGNSFVFKDIEESLERFDGEEGKKFEKWVKEFDDISAVCGWNEAQKYLYTEKKL